MLRFDYAVLLGEGEGQAVGGGGVGEDQVVAGAADAG